MKLIRAIFEGRSVSTPSGGSSGSSNFVSRASDHPSRARWWPPAQPPSNTRIFDGSHHVPQLQRTNLEPDCPDPALQQQYKHRCCELKERHLATTDNEPEMVIGGGDVSSPRDDYDVWSTTAAFPPDDGCHSDVSEQDEPATGVRRSRRRRRRVQQQRHVTFTVTEDRFSDNDDTEHAGPIVTPPDAVRRSGGGNPLLETISAIEDLHPSDDECSEVDGNGGCDSGAAVDETDHHQLATTPTIANTTTTTNTTTNSSDGERDSTGYSSSNSMDSGYKSSCPALAATLATNEDTTNRIIPPHVIESSLMDETNQEVPTMMSNTPPHQSSTYISSVFASSTSTDIPCVPSKSLAMTNRLDNGFYDVNLDHLMYLRQSLLGGAAMKKCVLPVMSGDIAGVVQESTPDSEFIFSLAAGGGAANRVSQTLPRSSTLRTSASFKAPTVTPAKSSQPDGAGAAQSSVVTTSCGCPCCLGEDGVAGHDSRAEYYDLENVNEFPCAYGTMVENRFNNSCLARVKKLKESAARELDNSLSIPHQHPSSNHFTNNSCATSPTDLQQPIVTSSNIMIAGVDYNSQQMAAAENKMAAAAAAKLNRDDVKERAHVSEVTKCILKIIDDIQLQQQHAINEASIAAASTNNHKTEMTSSSTTTNFRSSKKNSLASNYDSRRLSGADYHVYEEIAYGLTRNYNSAGNGSAVIGSQSRRVGHRNTNGEVQYVNVPSRKGRPSRLVATSGGGRCAGSRRPEVSLQPPPLPARPNEIFGNSFPVTQAQSTAGQLCSAAVPSKQRTMSQAQNKMESTVAKGLNLNQSAAPVISKEIVQSRSRNDAARRGSQKPRKAAQLNRFPVSSHQPIQLQTKEANDDDYGFKLIKTMT